MNISTLKKFLSFILLLIIGFSIIQFSTNASFRKRNPNIDYTNKVKIETNKFFFNNQYEKDINKFNKEFLDLNNLYYNARQCLDVLGPKYYKTKQDIRKFCMFRITELLKNIHHPLSKKYKYIKYQEEEFLYSHGKKPIDNLLLKYINLKEPNTKVLPEEENIIKKYLSFYNNGSVNINKIILKDLEKLNGAYKRQFNENIVLNSGFRSLEEQIQVYNKYKKIYGPNQKIATIPGFSEHHLGTAIDIHRIFLRNSKGVVYDNNYTWLKQHSWEYGFIQSYDYNCSKEGIINEDWHYRYIGPFLSQKWKKWKEKPKNKNKCNIYFIKEINNMSN